MSYDYFLFARTGDGQAAPTLESFASEPRPIGTPEQLMERISAMFPAVTWEPPHGDVDAWFGANGPEFLFSPDPDGFVSTVKAAYIEPDQVRALAAALDLVTFDPQKGCFVGG
jgi:hypothetical protein